MSGVIKKVGQEVVPKYYRQAIKASSACVNQAAPRFPVEDPTKLSIFDRIGDGNLGQTMVVRMNNKIPINKNTKHVGTDHHGNMYFENKDFPLGLAGASRSRWVVYADHEDFLDAPSGVPPEWHGWLNWVHPDLKAPEDYADVKPFYHVDAQLTASGTDDRYQPKGSWMKGSAKRNWQKYSAWTPPQK
mmetsp:Transcript_13112/g.15849  ORF Transcript_13112/g.15849 Transcript_13112/m.15849 type:complete len:188 (+) Transcript_13112:73-636(+)|eukprot:CAMPEP_0197847364 /NCGR_PEP_ID=MMETSP1438-20131217/5811_1 /TAXON_ID=1461541 /ORGANISM="Pterosperma sp., Strain CCMP1384" /LENGTH=187 /DNA_ID=CAMNT_0043459257 /DNA_START=72 /DNA_END=635 /DNA_ORIENTATION=+